MRTPRKMTTLAMMSTLLFGALGSSPAFASFHVRGRVEIGDWHRGHWTHDRHDGRLGWWWVVGPSWHYYDRPYVEAPPQTVIIQQQPAPPPVTVVQAQPAPVQSPVMYYCKATGTHYPETITCPGGWVTMTADTPPQP